MSLMAANFMYLQYCHVLKGIPVNTNVGELCCPIVLCESIFRVNNGTAQFNIQHVLLLLLLLELELSLLSWFL